MADSEYNFNNDMDKQSSQDKEFLSENEPQIESGRLEQLAMSFKEMTDKITSDLKSKGRRIFPIRQEEIRQKLTADNISSLEEIKKLSDEDKIKVFRKVIELRKYKEDVSYDLKMCNNCVKLMSEMTELSPKDKEKLIFVANFVAIKNIGTETALNQFDKNGFSIPYDEATLDISKSKVIPFLLEKALGKELADIFVIKTHLGSILNDINQILAESHDNPSKFYLGATDKKIIVDNIQVNVKNITKQKDGSILLHYIDDNEKEKIVLLKGRVKHQPILQQMRRQRHNPLKLFGSRYRNF